MAFQAVQCGFSGLFCVTFWAVRYAWLYFSPFDVALWAIQCHYSREVVAAAGGQGLKCVATTKSSLLAFLFRISFE